MEQGFKLGIKKFISNIFSVRNEDIHKIISILGLKIKLKSEKRIKNKMFNDLKKDNAELRNSNIELRNSNIELRSQITSLCSHIGNLNQQFENLKNEVQELSSQLLSLRCEKFVNDNIKYLNNPAKTKKRRLFLTTGNLSLLNNLTLIKQLNEPNCEDVLFVFSHIANPIFNNTCKQMASLHNFEKVYIETGWKKDYFKDFFIENKLFDFDEIYFSNQYQFINLAQKLYPNAKWFLTDEGCAALIAREYMDYDRVEKIYLNNYMDKLDFFGLNKENYPKIVHLDNNIFRSVAKECSQMFPVNLGLNKGDKAILFCGMWWENSGLTQEEYFELQNSTIERLQSMGYKVIFKPHPRDNRDYVSELGVTALETSLPLECYDFDIVGAVSLLSTVTLQAYGVNGIPSFVMMPASKLYPKKDAMWVDAIIKYMLTQYTTPVDILYSVNPNDYSKDELKQILAQKCADYLNLKPMLSQNSELIEFAKQCGYEFKANEKETLFV